MRALAYEATCNYCHAPVYRAMCSDGRYRAFDRTTIPAGPCGVWAWRKHQGMQEQEMVPGKSLHYCPQYRDRPGHPYNIAPGVDPLT